MSRRNSQFSAGDSQRTGNPSNRRSEQLPRDSLLDPTSNPSSWFFPGQPEPSLRREGLQGPGTPSIGAASSFYGGNLQTRQYQHWIDAFDGQTPSGGLGMPSHRGDFTHAHIEGTFPFSQSQFPNPNSLNPFPTSTSSATAGAGSSAFPSNPSFDGDSMDSYHSFYDRLLGMNGQSLPSTSPPTNLHFTPESTLHSYTGTPDPSYQQQQQALQGHAQAYPSLRSHNGQGPPRGSPVQGSSRQAPVTHPYSRQPNPVLSSRTKRSSPDTRGSQKADASSGKSSRRNSSQLALDPAPTAGEPLPPALLRTTKPKAASTTPAASSSGKTAPKRKRAKNDEMGDWNAGGDSDEDSDSDEQGAGYSVGMGGVTGRGGKKDKASRL
ncbi:hypothetical protein D9611_010254 [Ephemerocybe angulata]|uniref:Uncharacterized protein n=1 Tax=Ephemerocybe angulata TaxID=980116 RepID=A0A8H5F1F4_9AGAR|nr:hypothetical protein D9611_010254 [Tulosesus angulatus]